MIENLGKILYVGPWVLMILSLLAGIVFVFFPRDLPNTRMFSSRWIFVLLACVVLAGTAIALVRFPFAALTALPVFFLARPARAGPGKVLSNRGLIPGVWAMWLLFLLMIAGLVVYFAGGCESGFKDPAKCTAIPDDIGQVAYNLGFGNMMIVFFLLPLLLIVGVLIEAATRYVGRPLDVRN